MQRVDTRMSALSMGDGGTLAKRLVSPTGGGLSRLSVFGLVWLSVFLTTTVSCSTAVRSDVPEDLIGSFGRSVDSCHWSQDGEGYDCAKDKAHDYLVISRNTDPAGEGALYVKLELHFFNGHTCSLDYPANWNDGRLEIIDGVADEENAFCSLDIDVAKDQITIHDNDIERCSMIYCGTRGMFEGTVLRREDEPH